MRKTKHLRVSLCILMAALLALGGIQFSFAEQASASYNDAITSILNSLPTQTEQVDQYTAAPIFSKNIALVFEGIASESIMQQILTVLRKYKVKATFFLPGVASAENPRIAQAIVKEGHAVGNYLLNGEKYVQTLSPQEQVRSIYRTQQIMLQSTGQLPKLIKCNVSLYTEDLRKVIKACGLEGAIVPTIYLNHLSFSSEEQVAPYVAKTPWGALVSIKINQQLDESEYIDIVKDLDEKPAIDKQPSADVEAVPTINPELVVSDRLIQVVEWLVKAYVENGFGFVAPEWLTENQSSALATLSKSTVARSGEQAKVFDHAYTTMRAVGLTFDSLGDDLQVRSLLVTLSKLDIKASFVVTGQDILERKSLLMDILSWGHTLINGGFSGNKVNNMTYEEILLDMQKNAVVLEQELKQTSKYYRPPSGVASQAVLESCKDAGMVPVTYNKNPRPENGKTVEQVMEYFKWGVQRGDIITLQMDQYAQLNELVESIAGMVFDTGYTFASIPDLYEGQYERVALEDIPGWDTVKVNASYNPRANTTGRLITKIPTDEKVMFITFDDWGSDRTITKILDTLEANGVKATFFVRGSGAANNPNLLRAIAEAGHDICNHTYSHDIITSLKPEELQQDVVKNFQLLAETIGRVPELIFRPPQLEKNTAAVNAVIATGYRYVLQSDVSTQDYKRTASEVIRYVMTNLGKGRIIVLHMSDNASANEALPLLIKKLRDKGYSLGKVSDYLGK